MPSTFSDLKIELMATGEQSATWGDITNANLGTVIEDAIAGSADVSFSSADVTVTLSDTTSAQTARNLRLNLTGTSGGARNLILGSGCQIEKPYLINNGLDDAVTVKNTTGTGITVPSGKTMWVYNDGTNVVDAVTHLSSLTLGTVLPAASGGTGTSSSTGSGANVLATSPTIATPTITTPAISSPTFTSAIYANGSYRGNITAVAALDVDCSAGNYFTKSISANSTFTFSNAPSSRSYAFVLELAVTGSPTITWPAAVEWPSGSDPVLTAGKTHLFVFLTDDAGTVWRGAVIQDYDA